MGNRPRGRPSPRGPLSAALQPQRVRSGAAAAILFASGREIEVAFNCA